MDRRLPKIGDIPILTDETMEPGTIKYINYRYDEQGKLVAHTVAEMTNVGLPDSVGS